MNRRSRIRSCVLAAVVSGSLGAIAPANADPPPKHGADAPTTFAELKPTFFVLIEGADAPASTAISIGTANEINKAMKPLTGAAPWILPEPAWKAADLAQQCANDPEATGGVIVTAYAGTASHFYLLYQSETQTFALRAEVVACNRSPDGAHAMPTIVGAIAELPGARGTPWVVRRSQVSIPLISFAGLATLLTPKSSAKTTTSDITTAAVFSALVGQASNRDIPGYSTPLKLRTGSQEIGVDFVRAMRDLCTTHADLPTGTDASPRDKLCTTMGFTLDPTQVQKQQRDLDAYEAAEKTR